MLDRNTLYNRKASLIIRQGDKGLDLSSMHFKFQTVQEDAESPANCSIRVFNLKQETVAAIRGEYSRVVVQAGYEGNYGIVFDGTIKQYRIGREPDGVNTYLDILASDGDIAYNWATCRRVLAPGSTPMQRLREATAPLEKYGVKLGTVVEGSLGTGGILPRGKVLFGMAKAITRSQVRNMGATWSIQDGKIKVIALEGYLPGEAVVLTSKTGLIGRAEQTEEGIRVRCLMNPKLVVGGTVKIDNASINQIVQQDPDVAPLRYNHPYSGLQQLADISADGLYRIYVAEYVGDTRGPDWYVDLICLTIHPTTRKVTAYG